MKNHASIQQLLQTADIEGLIALGAPRDEYTSEAASFAEAMALLPAAERTEAQLYAILAALWAERFSLDNAALKLRAQALLQVVRALLN